MENNVQLFNFDDKDLAVKEIDGEVYFNAEQAAIGLGISQIAKSGNVVVRWERINKYLSSPQVGMASPQVSKGDFITEPQFYKLAIKANNSVAEKFQDWVTEEVLPSIRKHGAYLTEQKIDEVLDDPDTIIKLATKLKEERAKTKQLQTENTEMKPKADFYDSMYSTDGLTNISVIADSYGYTGVEFNKLLYKLGVQYKQGKMWTLYAEYKGKGYTQNVSGHKGESGTYTHMKWTEKGRQFLYGLLKGIGIVPTKERQTQAMIEKGA